MVIQDTARLASHSIGGGNPSQFSQNIRMLQWQCLPTYMGFIFSLWDSCETDLKSDCDSPIFYLQERRPRARVRGFEEVARRNSQNFPRSIGG